MHMARSDKRRSELQLLFTSRVCLAHVRIFPTLSEKWERVFSATLIEMCLQLSKKESAMVSVS